MEIRHLGYTQPHAALYIAFRIHSTDAPHLKRSLFAGDSLSDHVGTAFSTRDRDNDKCGSHCSQIYKGGWWHTDCHVANLNGLYLHDSPAPDTTGIIWLRFYGYHSLKAAPSTRLLIAKPVLLLPDV